MTLTACIAVWIVAGKTILDLAATVAFIAARQPALALMFAGFTIADAGALWLAL